MAACGVRRSCRWFSHLTGRLLREGYDGLALFLFLFFLLNNYLTSFQI